MYLFVKNTKFHKSRVLRHFCIVLFFCSLSFFALGQNTVPKKHTVSYGETLYRIAINYGVKVDDLKQWNGLVDNTISINQELIVGYETTKTIEERVQSTPEYIRGLENIVSQVENLYYESLANDSRQQEGYDTSLVNELFAVFADEGLSVDAYSDYNNALIKSLNADIGLDFYSSAAYNFEPGITEFEDLFYTSRFNAGLDWRLLNSGLFGNKRRIKELEVRNEINQLTILKGQKDAFYVYTYNYIIYLFNKQQLGLINRRLDIINKFLDVATQMYLVRATPWEEIVDLKNKKKALENIQRNLTKYNEGFEATYADLGFNPEIDAVEFPLLEIDSEKIFDGKSIDSLDIQLLDLQRQALQTKYQKNKDIGLRTYIRYNVFNGNNTGNNFRTFGSVGATFTAPLFQNKYNDQIIEKELAVLETENQVKLTSVNNTLLNLYYEYEYVFKQYMDFYGKKGVALERLRKEFSKDNLDDPSFTPLSVIKGIEEVYSIETEMLDIKQNLYLKLLRIYTNLDLEDVSTLGSPVSFEGYYDKMAGTRSLYVWSGVQKEFSQAFLSDYIQNNEFERVFVSKGDLEGAAIQSFNTLLSKQNVEPYRLIGNNDLALKVDSSFIYQATSELEDLGFSGINFDVEPHVFDDWASRKDFYLTNLVSTLAFTRVQVGQTHKISVSIPNHYPEYFIQNAAPFVDEFIVMCYENVDLEFIVNKLSEEVSLVKDKVTIALRTEDFDDRVKLELFIKELVQETGIDQIAIHDAGRLIKLDEKTILGN